MGGKPSPAEEIQHQVGLGAAVSLDRMPDGPLKTLYTRLLGLAYCRIYVNSRRRGSDIWQNTHVHICMSGARAAKSISMPNWNHVVINDGLIEQLIWDAYRVGYDSNLFSWFNDKANAQAVEGSSELDMKSISPENFINDFARFQIKNERRNSLVQALITISFLFVIDHEYRHLSAHHEFLSKSKETTDLLTMQALEHDSDTFASNRWVDMLVGVDKILDYGDTKLASAILGGQNRSVTYILFLYALFCGFRGLGQADWESPSFHLNSSHPPTSFRFKMIFAILFERLDIHEDPKEMETFKMFGPIIWPLLEYLYDHRISHSPLLNALEKVSSDDADNHFEKLYKKWRDLVIARSITDWIGDVPPTYESFF